VTSCDTNILFPVCDTTAPHHDAARAFFAEFADREDFCLTEQVLMELYCLLRNPTVCRRPLSGREAVAAIQGFRSNPRWPVVDVVMGGDIMRQVWDRASRSTFPYRQIFDLRLAATLRHHGVTRFATRNLKDFESLGFEQLWDPFSG
jgi:toxin-antitoxin system PIN domain toxin